MSWLYVKEAYFVCCRDILKLVCESAQPAPFWLILTLYTSRGSSLTDLYWLHSVGKKGNMLKPIFQTAIFKYHIKSLWNSLAAEGLMLSRVFALFLVSSRCQLCCVISEVIVLFESTVLYLLSSRLDAAKLQAFGLQPYSDSQAWLSVALLSAVAFNLSGCQWTEGLLALLLSPCRAIFSL